MYWLFALQTLLPVALVLVLACFPMRDASAFLLQAFASLLTLAALTLVGIWIMPPWWYPFLWLALGGMVAIRHWYKRREAAPGDVHPMRTAYASLGFGLLAIVACWQLALAVRGRSTHAEATVDLAFPLEAGLYLVVNGGSSTALNAHLRTLDPDSPEFSRWFGQSYGVDIVAIDRLGLRADGIQPRDPRAYRSFGLKVLAPCDGTVRQASDELPDQPVPLVDRSNMAGNYLLLRCADYEVVLGHLQARSLQVSAGQQVVAGQHVAAVGNTGNSDEPHLHIHAQMPGSTAEPLAGAPLRITLAGRFLLRNERLLVQ